MGVLVHKGTRVLVQGITGREGTFHTAAMVEYGTRVVAGVTPGKGNRMHLGVPVFDSAAQAVDRTGPDASVVFVPSAFAADAIMEAADAGIGLVACITEGIPILDTVKALAFLKRKAVRLIGPNGPGIITPGECKIGVMPGFIHAPGSIGVLSRSGTLAYEAVDQLTREGLGQSTCIGLGGDPVIGTRFIDGLRLFEEDEGTEGVVLIGEIGGTDEEEAAEYIRSGFHKPVIAYIAGRTAPAGKRMGHAGAIISRGEGTAKEKIEKLRACGTVVADSPADIGATVKRVMNR